MIQDILDHFHIEDIKNPTHPSVFFRHEKYDLFILRIPQYGEQKHIQFSSLAFIITEEDYYYYDKSNDRFVDLENSQGFYRFLDEKIDQIVAIKANYLDKIEKMEDRFYTGKSIKNFNQQWFLYKNELVRSNRLLYKAEQIMQTLITI